MPRTKVSKSSKRFREVSSREEKIRVLEASCDDYMNFLDSKGQAQINAIEKSLRMLTNRTDSKMLQFLMGGLLELNLTRFSDWQEHSSLLAASTSRITSSASMCNGTMSSLKRISSKVLNPNDEGYLTEDSSNGGGSAIGLSAATLAPLPSFTQSSKSSAHQLRGRTPGPLNSARARRPRRSRSVCEEYGYTSSAKGIPTATQSNLETHSSRSKMRTPITGRAKAFSADRTPQMSGKRFSSSGQSPPTAFMRWPKPGELVLSQCGSPVVAQVMPDKYANVNIPVRNGVLSLRPKKLGELKPDIIESIDPETLNQIKTLHANLNLIMKMADSVAQIK